MVPTYYGFVKRSQYGYTWVNFLEAESAHDLLEVASGSVGGDHGVQVQAALLEEHLVAEVVHGSDHPVAGPVPLPPAVRHVHVGVRPVVGVGQSPAGQGGAEHHVSVNKSLKHEGSFANISQSRKHRRLIVCSSSLFTFHFIASTPDHHSPEYPAGVLVEDHCVWLRLVHGLPELGEEAVDQDLAVAVHTDHLLAPQLPLHPLLLLLR